MTGSGLGLLGLRERMEAMGGTLTVSNGDDFVLRATLPAAGLATQQAAEAAAVEPPDHAPTGPTGEERP